MSVFVHPLSFSKRNWPKEMVQICRKIMWRQKSTELGLKVGPRLRDCYRPGQVEEVSKSRDKLHQTWGPPFSQALHFKLDKELRRLFGVWVLSWQSYPRAAAAYEIDSESLQFMFKTEAPNFVMAPICSALWIFSLSRQSIPAQRLNVRGELLRENGPEMFW